MRRPSQRVVWLGVLCVVALISVGLTLATRDQRAPTAETVSDVVDLPASGIVAHLERTAPTMVPATTGAPDELIVEVAAVAPVAALEVWAGDQLVASSEPSGEATTARLKLDWVPEGAGVAVLVARAIDRDGRSGQSNAVRVSVIEPRSPSIWHTATAVDGDTLASLSERIGFPAAQVLAANAQLPTEGSIAAGTVISVPDTNPAVGDGPPVVPPELESVALGGSGRGLHLGTSTPRPRTPASHNAYLAVAPPTLTVAVDPDTCSAAFTAAAKGDASVYVQALAPTASSFSPVKDLGAGGGKAAAPIGPGQYAYVATAFEGGSSSFSPPVIVNGPSECEGTWTGPLRLINGQLKGGKAADEAYLYLSTSPGRWLRVPGKSGTTVSRVGSSFDFSPYLPLLTGKRLEIDAWGWAAGVLVHIGRSVFVPPEGLSLSDVVGLTRTVRLDLVRKPGDGVGPEQLSDDVNIEDPGKLSFRWSTSVPGVTHGLWQVTTYPTTPDGPLDPAGVVAQGIAAGNGGDFDIDVAPLLDKPKTLALGDIPLKYNVAVGGFGLSEASPAAGKVAATSTSSSGRVRSGANSGVSSGVSADSAAVALPDAVLAKLDLPKPMELWVRILPFAKDAFRGVVSNQVHVDTRKQLDFGLISKLIEQQKELQEHPYDVQFDFLQPGAANLSLATCWSFTGWDATKVDQAAFNAAKTSTSAVKAASQGSTAFSYWIFLKILAAYPSSPLCATCYSAVGIGIGGAKCADTGGGGITGIPILDDILEAGGQFFGAMISLGTFIWDEVIVGTFNKVKDFVVNTLGDTCALFASASVGADAGAACHQLAAIAVDVALIAFGIPPNLPTTAQAVQLAKGEIAAAMVEMADDLGLPCDEIGTAAKAANKPDLTCEAAIDKMLNELGDQLQSAYHQEAKSLAGLSFPPGMNVVPHPAGQIAPAKFDITVTLKPGAPPPTAPCRAAVTLQSGWFTGPANPFLGQAVVDVRGLSGATVINQSTFGVGTVHSVLVKPQFFAGWPFTFTSWPLPTPTPQPDGTVSASKSFYLFEPTPHAAVPVTVRIPGVTPAGSPGGGGKPIFYNQPTEVPWHSFGLHLGASYVAVLGGSCFGFAKTTKPYVLIDEGPGSATKGVSE